MIPHVDVLNFVPSPSIIPIRFDMALSMPAELASIKISDALLRAIPRPRKVPSNPKINKMPGIISAIFSAGLATAALISLTEP